MNSLKSAAKAVPATTSTARRRVPKAQALNLAELPERDPLPLTFRELAQLYLDTNPSQADPMLMVRKWCDTFGLADVPAWEIKREQLEAGAAAMKKDGYAIGSINRNLSQIGTLYKFAIAQKITPAGFVSPTISMHRDPEPMRVVEAPQPGEWDKVRRLARGFSKDPRFTMLVWLVMDTGARRGEIDRRTWADFDLDAPEGPHIVLEALDVKTGKPRRLYFSHETAALVRRLRPVEKYRHVLAFKAIRGEGPNKYRKPWARLGEMLGRTGLCLHDMRHMVAADLLKAGKGMSQVSQLLGNSSLVLHRRYGHLDDKGVRDIQVERLALDQDRDEWAPVAEARERQVAREASAGDDAIAEAQRLQLVAQEAMAAAMAAAQAIAGMRRPPVGQPTAQRT